MTFWNAVKLLSFSPISFSPSRSVGRILHSHSTGDLTFWLSTFISPAWTLTQALFPEIQLQGVCPHPHCVLSQNCPGLFMDLLNKSPHRLPFTSARVSSGLQVKGYYGLLFWSLLSQTYLSSLWDISKVDAFHTLDSYHPHPAWLLAAALAVQTRYLISPFCNSFSMQG